MKLKQNIDYSAFLRTVQACRGEVVLTTGEGDRLNLKSALSQFIFAAAVNGNLRFAEAALELGDSRDADLLRAFVAEE